MIASILRCVEIDAGGVEAGLGELDRERQSDVAKADDAGPGAARLDLLQKGRGER